MAEEEVADVPLVTAYWAEAEAARAAVMAKMENCIVAVLCVGWLFEGGVCGIILSCVEL